ELDTYRGIATNIYTIIPPWFIHSPEIEQLNQYEQYVRQPSFTTCDRPNPHYHLTAREFIIYPNKYFIAKKVVFYFRNIPIFYYPVYRRGLEKKEASFSLTPGYSNRLGAFVKSSYSTIWDEHFLTRLHLDYYSKQGLGTGFDAQYNVASTHFGKLAAYYIDERETDQTRERVYLRHKSILTDQISFLTYIDYASDPEFDQDYVLKYVRGTLDTRESFLSFQNLEDNYVVRLTLHRLDEALPDETGTKEFELTEQQTPQLEFNTKYHRLGRLPFYFLWQSSIAQEQHPGQNLTDNNVHYTSLDAEAEPELVSSFQLRDNITYISSIGIDNSWSSKTSANAIYDEFQSRLDSEHRLRIRFNNNLKTDIFWRTLYRFDDPEDTELSRMESNFLGTRFFYRVPKTKLRLNWNTAYSLKKNDASAENEFRYSTRLDTSWQPRYNLNLFASGELLNQIAVDSIGEQDNATGQTWFASVNYYPRDWWWVSLGAKYQKTDYPNETFGQSTESLALYPTLGTNLGKKWKLQLGTGYEIGKADNVVQTTDSLYKQLILIRDLHCWEAYLRYQTWHGGSSWWFALNLKAYPTRSVSFDQKAGLF
ncbi:MAG: hypothetical protein QME64_11630, partial [bacterium]|nr:hypothetical protein [bacterium]